MRLNDAVDAVTGEVFRDGWSRIRGSMQGLHVSKQKQMVRAAAGHRAAVFKAIRGGGTNNKSELANQLGYLTTKSTHIVDSSGYLDGKSKLDRGEINHFKSPERPLMPFSDAVISETRAGQQNEFLPMREAEYFKLVG